MARNNLIYLFSIIIIGVLIYSNSLHGEFLSDDSIFIQENAAIQNIQNINHIWQTFNTRFIFGMSLALNYFFGGTDVLGYHLFNIIIHIINACLVFGLVLLLLKTPALKNPYNNLCIPWVAFFAGAIFLCHPIQTESVSFIFQRTSSLATLFYLGTIIFYIRARSSLSKKYLLLSFFSMLMAMFTKEMSVTIPLSLSAIELYFLGNQNKINWNNIKYVLPYFLFVFILLVTFIVFNAGSELGLLDQLTARGFSFQHLLTELNVIRTYIRLLIIPISLNHSYDYPLASGIFEPHTLISILSVTILIIAITIFFQKNRIISFCVLWFFISISVEITHVCFVQKGVIYEHWLYLAVVGYSILISVATHTLIKNKIFAGIFLTSLICILSVLTHQRNVVWKDPIALWTDVVQKSPKASLPYLNLGVAYMQKGQDDLAMNALQKSIELDPFFSDAYINIGLIQQSRGQNNLAIKNFNKALLLTRNRHISAVAYVNRGVLLRQSGEIKSAELDFLKAMELRPYLIEPYLNLGSLYMQTNNTAKAIEIFKKVLEISPRQKDSLYNLIRIYLKLGRIEPAKDIARDLLLHVNDPKILTSCASLLATYRINRLALQTFSKALKSDPTDENTYIELGKFYGNFEEFERAISVWQDGLNKFPQNQNFKILIEQAKDLMRRSKEKETAPPPSPS